MQHRMLLSQALPQPQNVEGFLKRFNYLYLLRNSLHKPLVLLNRTWRSINIPPIGHLPVPVKGYPVPLPSMLPRITSPLEWLILVNDLTMTGTASQRSRIPFLSALLPHACCSAQDRGTSHTLKQTLCPAHWMNSERLDHLLHISLGLP